MSTFSDRFTLKGRIGRYRYPIAISHRLTLAMSSWFPRAVPVVFVSGFPKSGTTWVCQLVADYLQLPFPQLSVMPLGFPAVLHGHEMVSPRRPHSVYVVRDGRDAMVSFYFAFIELVAEGDYPQVPPRSRRYLPNIVNRDHVRDNLPTFIEQMMENPASTRYNWPDHIRGYYDAKLPNVPLVRFEELRSNGPEALSAALQTLTGKTPEREEVEATLQRFSFARQRKRKPEETNKRKGQSGDWRNHFSRRAAEIFDHYAGDTLIELGYESDRKWIEECS